MELENKYTFSDGVKNPYRSKSWWVMAGYCCGLWDDRGYETRPDDDAIHAPDAYIARFEAWVDRHDALMEGELDVSAFNEEGRSLAVELKKW